ncbi:MAG: transporter substrate-binding domain-containing protein [Betaproteobacteria bacterium]|nr:MAG: transporter substrate-binding domain-containing protein [Betaproteobacteria bacterium]
MRRWRTADVSRWAPWSDNWRGCQAQNNGNRRIDYSPPVVPHRDWSEATHAKLCGRPIEFARHPRETRLRRAMPSRIRRRCIAWYLLAFVAVWTTAAAGPSRTLDRIKDEGTIHLGYRSGAAPFSFKERNGIVRGYSVELCTRIASILQKQLGLSKLSVEWMPVDASDRLEAVASGKVDIECGTTTIALSRMERVDFSVPIFVDGGSVLTKLDAKISRLADLNGKRVAVIPGTTTETALKRELGIVEAKVEIVPVRRLRRRSHRAHLFACRQSRSVQPCIAGLGFLLRALRADRSPR